MSDLSTLDTSTEMHLIQADSHSEISFNRVKKILQSHKIDLLFIDGDHSYEGVKKDYELYSPFVKKGGMIVFHDIVQNTTLHHEAEKIAVPVILNGVILSFKKKLPNSADIPRER